MCLSIAWYYIVLPKTEVMAFVGTRVMLTIYKGLLPAQITCSWEEITILGGVGLGDSEHNGPWLFYQLDGQTTTIDRLGCRVVLLYSISLRKSSYTQTARNHFGTESPFQLFDSFEDFVSLWQYHCSVLCSGQHIKTIRLWNILWPFPENWVYD